MNNKAVSQFVDALVFEYGLATVVTARVLIQEKPLLCRAIADFIELTSRDDVEDSLHSIFSEMGIEEDDDDDCM